MRKEKRNEDRKWLNLWNEKIAVVGKAELHLLRRHHIYIESNTFKTPKTSGNWFFLYLFDFFNFQTTPDTHRATRTHAHTQHSDRHRAHATNFMINKINRIWFGCHRQQPLTSVRRTHYAPRTSQTARPFRSLNGEFPNEYFLCLTFANSSEEKTVYAFFLVSISFPPPNSPIHFSTVDYNRFLCAVAKWRMHSTSTHTTHARTHTFPIRITFSLFLRSLTSSCIRRVLFERVLSLLSDDSEKNIIFTAFVTNVFHVLIYT